MYRRTKKVHEARKHQLEAMRRGKERSRMMRPSPEYPALLPELRMRITVERFDFCEERHVFEMRKSNRVDTYRVYVDGQPWKRAGLTGVLEGIRKACPRVLSTRAMA
jgi:hypothetical protein